MGTNRRFSEKDCAELRRVHEQGRLVKDLAVDHGCHPETIKRAIAVAGGKVGGETRVISSEVELEMLRLYREGCGLSEIRSRCALDCANLTFNNILRRNGVPVRSNGPPPKERVVTDGGYALVRIRLDDPMASMARKISTHFGYVLEHRLVLARKLDRPLMDHETVHHRNGARLDNRPDNLELRVGQHGRGATEAHCSTCRCFEGS